MYPRVKRISNEKVNEVVMNFFTKNQAVEFNKELCVGCGICIKVCPKEAICYGPGIENIRKKTKDMIPLIPDAFKCSYCGTCAYMCPFSAVTLKKMDKEVTLEDLDIVKKKVVPNLDFKLVNCKNIGRKAKIYFEGNVSVDWNKCVSCLTCTEVCPTNAFFKSDSERFNDEGKKIKVDFNPSICINCGTCVNGCSKNAITMKIDKVNYSGDYKEIFWDDILHRLKK